LFPECHISAVCVWTQLKWLYRVSRLVQSALRIQLSVVSVSRRGGVDMGHVNFKRFWRRCVILCGDGFMDFIQRPKSKILKS
jgi:hypothetical protein